MEYIVKNSQDFLKALLATGRKVWAPKMQNGRLEMAAVADSQEVSLDYINTHDSPKKVFFPQTEKLMAFHKDQEKPNSMVYQPLGLDKEPADILFGLRPCDARALRVCDNVFQNNRFTDPYWKTKYESALKIGLACQKPGPACFCTALGGSPFSEEGLDILAMISDGGFLLKAISDKGTECLKSLSLESSDVSTPMTEAKKATESQMSAPFDLAKLQNAEILDIYNQEHWADTAARCLNCGTCTFVCPTCHCFDIQDEENEKGGVRVRNWDTCMSWLYTIHGTGHNPRPTKTERMRQRFMHKLKYIPLKQNGACGCVGCGRCLTLCPVNIDIREVAQQMNQAN